MSLPTQQDMEKILSPYGGEYWGDKLDLIEKLRKQSQEDEIRWKISYGAFKKAVEDYCFLWLREIEGVSVGDVLDIFDAKCWPYGAEYAGVHYDPLCGAVKVFAYRLNKDGSRTKMIGDQPICSFTERKNFWRKRGKKSTTGTV
jgi:hypothetical protein